MNFANLANPNRVFPPSLHLCFCYFFLCFWCIWMDSIHHHLEMLKALLLFLIPPHFSVGCHDIQKIHAFRFRTPKSISLRYYSVRNIGLSGRTVALTPDCAIFRLKIRGGEPTNKNCTSQKRCYSFVGDHSSEDLLSEE
jgi:hypothetical protein